MFGGKHGRCSVVQEAICRDALQSLVQLVTDGKPKAQAVFFVAREWSVSLAWHKFIQIPEVV